jgi:prepilin-type N-terminal cleavage/methylation domain-containing protein/prepilin-type processing-associated H-X9-DG protein
MIPRSPRSARPPSAFTLPELAIVLVVIVVLALLAIPAIQARARARAKGNRIKCVNNLKNVGLALRIFSTDNNGAWPWQVSTNDGGSKEFLQDPSLAWPHFHALSNELSTPRIARCPNELTGIQPATWRDATNNSAFSYFLGLGVDASEENPNTIMGGDSNLELNGQRLRSTLVTLRTNANLRFDNSRVNTGQNDPWHATPDTGNILFGDGSVQHVTSARLREALLLPGDPTNSIHRWLIP